MILTGSEIKKCIANAEIDIEPYDESRVQPASIDLTLGTEIRVYKKHVTHNEDGDPDFQPGASLCVRQGWTDSKCKQETDLFTIGERGFLIVPGILYLMHTEERIYTEEFVSVLDGKSSIGRLGVVVHLTAGYGDPGFNGQYTLEVTCVHPVILYPGMAIAQMRFHTMQGEVDTSYATKGHYVDGKAQGAIPSMSHKQFGRAE